MCHPTNIFPAPCSRYEQFVNLYSNINTNQPRRARFAAAQAEWTSAKKAGRIDTVFQAMKEKLQSRGRNVESQKSKFECSGRVADDFPHKKCIGGWVGGLSSIQLFFGFLEFV